MCKVIAFPISDRARQVEPTDTAPPSVTESRARSFNSFCNQVCDDMIAGQVSKEAAEALIALYLRDHMGEK